MIPNLINPAEFEPHLAGKPKGFVLKDLVTGTSYQVANVPTNTLSIVYFPPSYTSEKIEVYIRYLKKRTPEEQFIPISGPYDHVFPPFGEPVEVDLHGLKFDYSGVYLGFGSWGTTVRRDLKDGRTLLLERSGFAQDAYLLDDPELHVADRVLPDVVDLRNPRLDLGLWEFLLKFFLQIILLLKVYIEQVY